MAALLAACSASGDPNDPSKASAQRDTEIKHEECDIHDSDAKVMSVDGKRPVIIKVFDGGREACRAVDLNQDGLIDTYRYFDDQGRERRRESGLDVDDRPDMVRIYENGQLVMEELETNNDRKIDTWSYFQNGRMVRQERDSTGDGYIDQWWSFPKPDLPNCSVVVSDLDGDGKPDEESRLEISCEPTSPPPAPKPKEESDSDKDSTSEGAADSAHQDQNSGDEGGDQPDAAKPAPGGSP